MEIAIGVQILSLAGWLLVIKFLQLSLWPALVPAFGRYAYGAAYPGSILLLLAGS